MATNAKSNKKAKPGRVTLKGTHGGKKVGRYVDPETSGRITAPIPVETKHSPQWFGPTSIALLLGGLAVMLGNWLTIWPGSYSPWYLVGGLVISGTGFGMLTQYH